MAITWACPKIMSSGRVKFAATISCGWWMVMVVVMVKMMVQIDGEDDDHEESQ